MGAAFLAYQHLGAQASLGVAVVFAAVIVTVSYQSASRQSSAELRAARQEIIVEGVGIDERRFKVRIACFDIRWLEYRSPSEEFQPAQGPGGLYAVTADGNVCLFPGLDERQTAEVIQRIGRKFPELRGEWAARCPWGGN